MTKISYLYELFQILFFLTQNTSNLLYLNYFSCSFLLSSKDYLINVEVIFIHHVRGEPNFFPQRSSQLCQHYLFSQLRLMTQNEGNPQAGCYSFLKVPGRSHTTPQSSRTFPRSSKDLAPSLSLSLGSWWPVRPDPFMLGSANFTHKG